MKYLIKCITSLQANDNLTLNEKHVYEYVDKSGIKYSDTSVSKLYTKDNGFFDKPEMKAKTEVGTKLHTATENFVRFNGLTQIHTMEEARAKIESANNEVIQGFLLKVLSVVQDADSIQMHPEVRLFAAVKDPDGKVLYVGGSIDLLVVAANKTEIKYYIFDLKTGSYSSTHDKQVATYEKLFAMCGHHDVRSMCLYTGSTQTKFCKMSEKSFEDALDKAFKEKCGEGETEILLDETDLTDALEKINEEYEELKQKLEEKKKQRDNLITTIVDPYKDVKNGTLIFNDRFKYTITTYQRKTIDEVLVSKKCPEAICYKETKMTRLIQEDKNA